jgi:S1-C subfamily serine protease
VELPEAIRKLAPAIVQISGMDESAMEPRSFGTGFFVSQDAHVVTAKHVIDAAHRAANDGAVTRVSVGLAHENTENMRANFTFTGFDVMAEDGPNDLALLRLRNNPFEGQVGTGISGVDLPCESAALATDRPRDGTNIAVSGYPLSNPVLITNGGHIASRWGYEVKNTPAPGPAGKYWPEVSDQYLADVEINPGNSGGPCYAVESGDVLGVCVANQPSPVRVASSGAPAVILGDYLVYSSGLAVIVPSRYVAKMLAEL